MAGRWQVADAARAHDAYGWRSLVTAVMNLAQVRKGQAVNWQVVASQLPRLEQTTARLAAGSVSFDNAAAICHAVRHLNDADAAAAEQILLELADAAGTNTADVTKAGRKINDVVDDARDDDGGDGDGAPGPAERQAERQHLSISKLLDGMYRIDGMLDAETGQLLKNVLEPLAKKIDADDDRPKRRRLAEALLAFLRGNRTATTLHVIIEEADLLAEQAKHARHASGDNPDTGNADSEPSDGGSDRNDGDRSTGNNDRSGDGNRDSGRNGSHGDSNDGDCSNGGRDAGTPGAEDGRQTAADGGADAEARADAGGDASSGAGGRDGARAGWPGPMPPGWRTGRLIGPHGRAGMLPDDQLIPPGDVLRMAGSSLIRRVVVNAEGIIVDFGRARRLATPDQRAALAVRYRSCARTSCDVDADHCEVEHVYGWVDEHGETNLDELCLLCPADNKWAYRHPDRVTKTRHPDGRWHYTFHHHTGRKTRRRARPRHERGP